MDAFLVATGIVALAEIGDKTQLLAFLLAARFRRPLPIILGNARNLSAVAGSDTISAVTLGGAPGEQLFSLPFKSPSRSGVEHIAVGLDVDRHLHACGAQLVRDRVEVLQAGGPQGRCVVGFA